MAKNKFLDELPIEDVRKHLDAAYQYVNDNHPEILKEIDKTKEISPANEKAMQAAIEDYFKVSKE